MHRAQVPTTNPQSAFITIQSIDNQVKGIISERDWPKLAIGQNIEVLIHAVNETISGRIIHIGDRPITHDLDTSALNSNSNLSNYKVNIELDSQENLINGFHVQGMVKLTNGIVSIPKGAILSKNGSSYVYIVKDNKYIKQLITYSEKTLDEVSILSGLKYDDQIVLNPTLIMEEGAVHE